MQAFGQFQLVHRSAFRTQLRAPSGCGSAANLAAVRRRLVACDGILAVAVNPETGSVVVRHSPAFSWASIGRAAWRLEPAPADPLSPAIRDPVIRAAPAARSRAPRQPLAAMVEELISLAIEGVIARRPATQIMQDIARSFLATTLREPDRA